MGVRKSLGCGSPLIEGISADEEWPADEWSNLNRECHRSRLGNGALATVWEDEGASLFAHKNRASKSSKQIQW